MNLGMFRQAQHDMLGGRLSASWNNPLPNPLLENEREQMVHRSNDIAKKEGRPQRIDVKKTSRKQR